MRIVWTKRYLSELEAIDDYIAEHNPCATVRNVGDIHGKTDRLLSSNPFIGRRSEIKVTRVFSGNVLHIFIAENGCIACWSLAPFSQMLIDGSLCMLTTTGEYRYRERIPARPPIRLPCLAQAIIQL